MQLKQYIVRKSNRGSIQFSKQDRVYSDQTKEEQQTFVPKRIFVDVEEEGEGLAKCGEARTKLVRGQ